MRLTIIAALALAAAGCGGGPSASLAEYFTDLESLNADIRSRQQQADIDYDAVLSSATYSERAREGFADYLTEQRDIARLYADRAGDLDPPEEAVQLHAASIVAYVDFAESIERVIGTVEQARTLDQLVGALGNTDAIEAAAATTATCLALQQLADDEDVAVDLECES